jgi:hypothetical protein
MSKYLFLFFVVLLISCGTESLCPSYGTGNKSTDFGQRKQKRFHAKNRMNVPFRF